jgi:hypothetical protein
MEPTDPTVKTCAGIRSWSSTIPAVSQDLSVESEADAFAATQKFTDEQD